MCIRSGKGWTLALTAALLAATLLLAACGGASPENSGTITVAGSTTVQPLAEKLANAFRNTHHDVHISIQGGGSSTGVKSVANGTVDIGAASRELEESEQGQGLVTHLLCRDAIAVVTHPDSVVTGLSARQVRGIFAGDITNWSQVGGASAAIHVIAREEGSGTRAAFEELVMEDSLITADAILLPSNGALRTAVSGDPDSIGFLSFAYVNETIQALAIDGVTATRENAVAGTYPILRPLYFLTLGEPSGIVKDFIDFAKSVEGQAIMKAEGYIGVG
ncbi:MAG: phosphate-binding protein [Chloroflexi bacterium]|nr:MAG: phosphate-binding protein [Chloroflexota bacterium]